MNTNTFNIRKELHKHGVKTQHIQLLKLIVDNPRITTAELAMMTGKTRQAIVKQTAPLEAAGVIVNTHGHPLWKAWTVQDAEIAQLLTQHP